MRVAIDNGPLTSGHSVRGIGVHTKELIEELGKLRSKEIQIEAVDFSRTDLSKYDIVHYPYFHPFFLTLPFQKPSKKVVVTIHDLIPLIYPKHYPPGLKGSIRFLVQKFLLRNVDAVITISETSKKDICRFLGVSPEKIHVVYLAPKKIFRKLGEEELKGVKNKYNLPEKFVLYVGDVNYNKNIPNLIKACRIAKIPLVISGKQALEIEEENLNHPELSHLKGVDFKDVLRFGFVQDEDLVGIYNLATLYCQPSFYEGFGLTVLEAIACGTPVVASRTQALVEIAEGAATFVDAGSPKDIAKGFNKLIANPKLPRIYSWQKTAEETLNVYAKV